MENKKSITRKTQSIIQAAGVIGILTLLSRLVGLYRDRYFAATFGAGDILDAYNSAFRLPDLIYNLLILGTLSAAFIPVFAEYFVKDESEANKITNTVLTCTFLIMGVLCGILYFFVPQITHLIAPGFSGQKFHNTTVLTRIFLASPIIFTVSNVFSSYLNALKRFFVVSFAPILYNLGIIFGVKYFYPRFGIAGLGYGVILGALAHLSIQIIASIYEGLSIRPNFDISHEAVKKIGKLFLPRILGMDQAQFSLIIASIIGSTLASGTITIFSFANNLQAVPVGIFALSFAIAAFPQMSEHFAKGEEKEFSEVLSKTIVNVLFFVVPLSVLFILLRFQIVRVLLGTGRFSLSATELTAESLGIFSLSIFAQSLTPLLSRAFYSRHNTKIPVAIGLFSLGLNAVMSYFLARPYGVAGMAASFSIASILGMFIYFVILHRFTKFVGIAKPIFKIIIATVFLSVATYLSVYLLRLALPQNSGWDFFIQGLIAGLIGIAVFLVSGKLLKLQQTESAVRIVKRRILG